jgi:hypothetical protein
VAKLFLFPTGQIGLRKTAEEEAISPLPGDATDVVEFDEVANAQTIADFDSGYARFTFSGGVYRKDGAQITFLPPSVATVQAKGQLVGSTRVGQDRSTTSASYVDVPDMQFELLPNSHYNFEFKGAYTAAAATTGAQLAVSGPSLAGGFLAVGFEIYTSATAVLAAVAAAYDVGVLGTASGGAQALPFFVSGNISTGPAGGVLSLRGRTEVAGSAVTIKRGSFGVLWKVG